VHRKPSAKPYIPQKRLGERKGSIKDQDVCLDEQNSQSSQYVKGQEAASRVEENVKEEPEFEPCSKKRESSQDQEKKLKVGGFPRTKDAKKATTPNILPAPGGPNGARMVYMTGQLRL